MNHKGFLHGAILTMVVFLCQGTMTLAGTTGVLTGNVNLDDGSPVAAARVTVTSPSQTVSTTADSSGHFAFVSLVPDTYAISASREDIETVTQRGVTILADNTRTITLHTRKALKVLGRVTVRSAADLVKPGTTADVYSVNAATADKIETLGGGGGLGNAYSAIASVPGAIVPPGQYGWFQTIYIRGGDYDQVGYEFDGVPVLRSYDNYPTVNASTLGQQELQVYTGAEPTNSQSQGLSGYINQVIKSGTYPTTGTFTASVGAPALVNSANIEVGGATQTGRFSYYLGFGGYDTSPRLLNNSMGADVTSLWGTPNAPLVSPTGCSSPATVAQSNYVGCYASGVGPGGYQLAPYQVNGLAHLTDRENLINLHFGIPHGENTDDVQALYDWSEIWGYGLISALDWGLDNVRYFNFTGGCPNGTNPPGATCSPTTAMPVFAYANSFIYKGPLDAPLPGNGASPAAYQALTIPYAFPHHGNDGFGNVATNFRDGNDNGQSIVKLQYQRNFSSNSYLRLYGYLFYSTWFNDGPISTDTNYVAYEISDYELSNHTRGGSLTYANQITPKHLLTAQYSMSGALNYRDNNTTMVNNARFLRLVDPNNPDNGVCYSLASLPFSCYSTAVARPRISAAVAGTIPVPSGACGTGPCTWWVVEDNQRGGANLGHPLFTNASITDQFKPDDKWLFNYGVRFDRYAFKGSDTNFAPGPHNGTARGFWLNAWNNGMCVSTVPGSQPVVKLDMSTPCNSGTNYGSGFVPATLINLPGFTEAYNVWQPRFGATYSAGLNDVLRFNYGRYSEGPNAAFQQYNVLQQDLAGYDGARFYGFGFTTTSHAVGPEVSNNADFSWEHRFSGTSASFKITPYYRKTHGQIQNFYLDQKTNFVSGLNCCDLTASGVELELQNGDFSKNGWSELLSYTYTNSFEHYNRLQNGSTAISTVNKNIQVYNAYTSFCASNPSDSRCGSTTGGTTAGPCVNTTTGAFDNPCAPGDIANPYWNAPVQPLFDENGIYRPFSLIPGGLNANVATILRPHVATFVANYRQQHLTVTPAFQFFSGDYYGAPLQTYGVDPLACSAALTSAVSGDPRYPYGAKGGAPFDATSCGGTLAIPNPYTAKYDNLGAFRNPSQLLMHMQISYEAPRITYKVNLLNIINTCFGGNIQPWTKYSDHRVCTYSLPGYAPLPFGGNVYNPGSAFQPIVQFPYMQYFGVAPFQVNFEIKAKL